MNATTQAIIERLPRKPLLSPGDVRRCIYWLAAATLTATVTF